MSRFDRHTPPGVTGPNALWAKSQNDDGDWLSLPQHLVDTAGVAGWLWDSWLPARVRDRIVELTGLDAHQARSVAVFLAGVHDIGKATPAFQHDEHRGKKVSAEDRAKRPLLDLAVAAGFDMTCDRSAPLHHTVTGHVILGSWLTARGWRPVEASTWAVVVGGHHGRPPSVSEVSVASKDAASRATLHFGRGASWGQARDELLAAHWSSSGADALDGPVALPQQVQVVLTGLVIVADWIASNEDYHPYSKTGDQAARTRSAMGTVNLPRPWSASDPGRDADTLLADRFDLGAGTRARPVQHGVVEMAWEMPEPGILVVEAPMGEGKTEAALLAAEVLAHRFGCGGVQVALPTQGTADGMFSRFLAWADRLPETDVQTGASVFLGHGKSGQNKLYRGLASGRAAVDVDGGRDAHRVGVHDWLTGRKKAHLASFSVTTIDQLLLAALRAKHLSMRHLGVAGKVVVIDEVHAYDAWMSVYLERVLTWLGAYRVPVVLLSATLPPSRREALLHAYTAEPVGDLASGYPVLTGASPGHLAQSFPSGPARSSYVRLERERDVDGFYPRVRAAVEAGACVLVVRNTVAEAVETGRKLTGELGETAVSVCHSRFLAADRARNDADLVARFGRDGSRRPTGHVVVATQVVEQSLDVDFDLLLTDPAPVDLLLQRMGRLHRHDRARPDGYADPVCVIVGVDSHAGFDVAPSLPKYSELVYGRWALLRAEAVLAGREGVHLPGDIAGLVSAAYDGDDCPDGWREVANAAREEMEAQVAEKKDGASVFRVAAPATTRPVLGWIDGSVTSDSDERAAAQVRDSDETLEVVVCVRGADGLLRIPDWLVGGGAGLVVPTDRVPSRTVCDALASTSVRLPRMRFPTVEAIAASLLRPERTPQAWKGDSRYPSPVSDVLLLTLDERGYADLTSTHHVHYDVRYGLSIGRTE